jgi:hypothetical protein
MNAYVRAEDWRQIITDLALDDNDLHLATGIKLWADENLKSGSLGVEIKLTLTNVGTDDVNLLFYPAGDGLAAQRSEQSLGSTLGLWDATLTGTQDLLIRCIEARHVGSGLIVGVQKAAGVTSNMVANVYARRFRGRD